VVASLPPSPQWKISSQLCKKEFHQKMKEKHTQDKESRDCTSPKAAVFKNTRNNDSPTQIKKKTQSTQQKFKPRILTFFLKSQKREREREGDRAAKTATRTMRSPREKQRQEKASSSATPFVSLLLFFFRHSSVIALSRIGRAAAAAAA